jgi:hypothetical protein
MEFGLHWRVFPLLLSVFFCTSITTSQDKPFVIEGYGEMVYSHFDFGPDQKSGDSGSPSDSRAEIDISRFVLEFKSCLSEKIHFETEIEFEHGGVGSALELDFEEFGEFEQEVEKGGEIELEQFHVTYSFSTAVNLRLGHFIVPVGLINKAHKPTQFFTARRPEAETGLIPTTWHETGAELFGQFGNFAYRFLLVNGLDSSGFSSKHWIIEGRQGRFEQVKITDVALATTLDYTGIGGLYIGVSAYHGGSTDNRPKPDMTGIDGDVTVFDLHAAVDRGPLVARALFLNGNIENADLISSKNSRLSTNLNVPRTPVAKTARAAYAEVGYDVFAFFASSTKYKLYPFLRYEYYNSMQEVDAGIFADPRFERKLLSFGLNFMPAPNVVVKTEYSHRTFGDNDINDENTFSVGLGFYGEFFEN